VVPALKVYGRAGKELERGCGSDCQVWSGSEEEILSKDLPDIFLPGRKTMGGRRSRSDYHFVQCWVNLGMVQIVKETPG